MSNEVTINSDATYTPGNIADMLDADPKSVRRFIRSHTSDRAGKGGKWAISGDVAARIVSAYGQRNNKVTSLHDIDLPDVVLVDTSDDDDDDVSDDIDA